MLDSPGGILCGKKGDSDPIRVERVSRWPRSGRQSEAQEPGRMLTLNVGARAGLGAQQGQRVESKEKMKGMRGSQSMWVPAV